MRQALSELLRNDWFLDAQWAHQVGFPLVDMLVNRQISLEDLGKEVKGSKAQSSLQKLRDYTPQIIYNDIIMDYDPDLSNVPGSIGVIPIVDAVSKYDLCGWPGMMTMANWVRSMDANKNISAIIIRFDTPGGSVAGTVDLAAAIRSSSTPVIAYVEDMAASAGVWLATSSKEVYANNDLARIGSIGVYTSWYNWSNYYKERGIDKVEVYSRLSTDKNKEYKEAEAGKVELLQNSLDVMASTFQNAVKINRAGKLDLEKENVLTGKMYFAPDALSFGLIDGVMNFESVIERARELGGKTKMRYEQV